MSKGGNKIRINIEDVLTFLLSEHIESKCTTSIPSLLSLKCSNTLAIGIESGVCEGVHACVCVCVWYYVLYDAHSCAVH